MGRWVSQWRDDPSVRSVFFFFLFDGRGVALPRAGQVNSARRARGVVAHGCC